MSRLRKILSYSILGLLFAFVLLGLANTNVKANEEGDIKVNIKAVYNDGTGQDGIADLDVSKHNYGDVITINAAHHSGSFALWVVDGLVDLEREASTTFVVTNDLEAFAVFLDVPVDIYIDHNGRHLENRFEDDEREVPKPSKIGYLEPTWTKIASPSETINIYKASYTLDHEQVTINGQLRDYNSIVTLTAEAGKVWFDGDVQLSLGEEYVFSALFDDKTLTQKAPVVEANLISMRELEGYRPSHTTYITQLDVANFENVIEYGLELDGQLRKASNLHPVTHEYVISIANALNVSSVRAYMIVKNGDNFETIYTDFANYITDAEIVYDFSSLEGKGALYNQATLNTLLANEHLDTTLDLDRVYNGGDTNRVGMLKLGGASDPGSFKIALKGNVLIKTVVVKANGWLATDKLSINGAEQALTLIANDRLVYVLDEETNIIEIVATNRALIYGLELYGPDITVDETLYTEVMLDYDYDDNFEIVEIVRGNSVELPELVRGGYEFLGWFDEYDVKYVGSPINEEVLWLTAKWEEIIVEEPVTDAGIILDFSGMSGTENTEIKDASAIETELQKYTSYNLTITNNERVYFGNGYVKFGASGANGLLEFKFDDDIVISKVIISAQGWGASEGKIGINSNASAEEFIGTETRDVTFDLLETSNIITLTTVGRIRMMYAISFYGPDFEFTYHTVTFDYNDEGATQNLVVDDVLDGNTVAEPENPVREGFKFIEWQLDGIAFDFNTPITGDLTLVAIWEEESTEPVEETIIILQSDFGKTNGWSAYTIRSNQKIENGSNDSNPNGSSFWNILGGNVNGTSWDFIRMGGQSASSVTDPKVYLATNFTFTEKVTKIIIEIIALDSANGDEKIHLQESSNGTNWTTITSQIIKIGDLEFNNLSIEANKYIRFVFERASTSSNRGTDIKNITFFTTISSQTTPGEDEYIVSFNTDGGNIIEDIIVKDGNKVIAPTEPTKAGFKFIGWFIDDEEFDFDTPIIGDLILTAMWEETDEVEETVATIKAEGTQITTDINAGDITSYFTITNSGSATLQVNLTHGSASTKSIFNNGAGETRLYVGLTLEINVPEAYVITNIKITTSQNGGAVINGTKVTGLNMDIAVTELSAVTIFCDNGQVRIKNIEITYIEK